MVQANKKDSDKLQVTSNELKNEKKSDNLSLVTRHSLPKKITRYLLLLFKVSVSATLFYMLVSRVGGKTIINNMRLLNPYAFIAAIAIYLVAAYFSTIRWKLLIPQNIETHRLFSMYIIGSFFNHYMPGGVGGDAVKAYYLNKVLKIRGTGLNQSSLTIAIASVFMDRYVGFACLLTISMIASLFGAAYLKSASAKLPVMWLIPSISAVFVLVSIAVFKFRIGERLKFLHNTYIYLQFYISRKDKLLTAFLYSAIIQILVIISVYILSTGLVMHLSFLSLLIFVPIIVLISMIPISISGIGLREGAFIFLLGSIGVPPEMSLTLSIVWFLSVFSASIWGFFEYLRFKTVLGREEK